MPRGLVCWPHQSTNTFCLVGAFVKEVVYTVVHLCSNLVEIIILVLNSCDTSLGSFHQVCLAQDSTNTMLWIARSGHYQGLHASFALQSESCGILISHLTQWTWPLVICTLWPRGCRGDHAFGVLCKVFVLCPVFSRPFLHVWACLAWFPRWS